MWILLCGQESLRDGDQECVSGSWIDIKGWRLNRPPASLPNPVRRKLSAAAVKALREIGEI